MRKTFGLFGLLAALAGIGWFGLQSVRIEGLDQVRIAPRRPGDALAVDDRGPRPASDGDTIRIASFNIQVFGESKLAKPGVVQVLAETVRRFNVVAIQEIRAASQDVLPRFVEQVNAGGRRYDYVLGERLGRTSSKEQYAFVFDGDRIELDGTSVYSVYDPDDLLHREPLAAGFRVRGPPTDEAFTFTLVNIHTDPDETDQELDALANVYRAVRNDGRTEDDIVLLGDLNVDDAHLGRLGEVPGIYCAISGVPSNTRGTKLYDNLLFVRQATTEFTGRSGVFDLMGEFKLSMDQALEVSDHLPVWAELNVYEGGRAGRLATRPEEAAR